MLYAKSTHDELYQYSYSVRLKHLACNMIYFLERVL